MPTESQPSRPGCAHELRCPLCGATYAPQASFCGRDGARLQRTQTASARAAGVAYAPTLPSTAPEQRCPSSGSHGEALIAGRYVKLRALGGGSQGEVWLVQDIHMGRLVALKRFYPGMDTARCRAEIAAARRIDDYSHIVKLYDLHYDPDTQMPFVTMEYLAGETLEGRLAHGAALNLDEALAVLRQASRGLSTMHRAELVHRDIKPANIMLVPTRDGHQVKLLDLGIARSLSPGVKPVTLPGWVLGTRDYAAPEQLLGAPVTPAFDVYGLGVVAHELCTGHLPDQAATREARVPRALRELIAQMLQADPALRPHSMQAVEDALARVEASLRPGAPAPDAERLKARLPRGAGRQGRIRVPKRAALPRFVLAAVSLAAAVYCLFSPLLQASDAEAARASAPAPMLTTETPTASPPSPPAAERQHPVGPSDSIDKLSVPARRPRPSPVASGASRATRA